MILVRPKCLQAFYQNLAGLNGTMDVTYHPFHTPVSTQENHYMKGVIQLKSRLIYAVLFN